MRDRVLVVSGKSMPLKGVANLAELVPMRVTGDGGLRLHVLGDDVREGEDGVATIVALLELFEKVPASGKGYEVSVESTKRSRGRGEQRRAVLTR
jgi:hypothetical protein